MLGVKYILHNNKIMKRLVQIIISILAFTFSVQYIRAQEAHAKWDSPQAGNPFIPGYFADPTIRKFGDTYYLYATTDGNGNGYGPAQVWVSKDFRNWTNILMDWPTTEVVWAPDVMQAKDGSYRYFYCRPCMLHEGVGPTPTGPWKNVLGETDAVLVPDRYVENCITLDGQTFTDDDGSTYIYFGTWGIYDGFGCGVARFNEDMKSFSAKKLIPNTQIKDFFEAPYVIKKDGIYYLMYSSGSCHDHTYRVQYATSTDGPMGPFEYKGCILKTNDDLTVHGPGHHSVLCDSNEYYIVYHRHNIPRSIHGFHRQLCIDRLNIHDGIIDPVTPTHNGVLPLSVASLPAATPENLAFGASVIASSTYSDDFQPSYAVDDNNATLWRPASCTSDEWLQIDLGVETEFDEIWTQFEYATYFYQYRISTSSDGQTWYRFADKQNNTLAGSPMVDRNPTRARYIRITITGSEKNGHFGAIWNIKVFNHNTMVPPQLQVALPRLYNGAQNNGGMLGGSIEQQGNWLVSTFRDDFLLCKGQPYTITYEIDDHRVAIIHDGKKSRLYVDGKDEGQYSVRSNRYTAFEGHFAFSLPDAERMRNLRVFSYALTPEQTTMLSPVAEIDASAYKRNQRSVLPLVSIDASKASSANLSKIDNEGTLGGHFMSPIGVDVKTKLGLQAYRFTGRQLFSSSFDLPSSMSYSAPYTISAWILNPQVERNECIAQLMPVRSDLSTVELCNGSDPQNGLMRHNASFENSGSPLIIEHQGQWQNWVITYDGYMERHYLNGCLVDEKNMMLVLRPQDHMLLGYAYGADYFDGYLHSFQLYDRTLDATDVQALYASTASSVQQRTAFIPERHVEDLGFGLQRITLTDPEGDPVPDGIKIIQKGKLPKPVVSEVQLTLTSAGGNLNVEADDNVALNLTPVSGDFLSTVYVADLSSAADVSKSGLDSHTTPSYNEGGLVAIDNSDPHNQRIVQLGVFPAYNCGNMLTTVSHHGRRPQHPRGNGWNFHPYLQLQRSGNLIYARTSTDGVTWEEMPASPVDITELGINPAATLNVGLFQVTYTPNRASVSFNDFKIIK